VDFSTPILTGFKHIPKLFNVPLIIPLNVILPKLPVSSHSWQSNPGLLGYFGCWLPFSLPFLSLLSLHIHLTVSVGGDFVSHSLIDSIWNWKRNCRWACVTTVEFRREGGQHRVIYELAGSPPPPHQSASNFPECPKHRHQHWHSPSTSQFLGGQRKREKMVSDASNAYSRRTHAKIKSRSFVYTHWAWGYRDSRGLEHSGTAAPWPVTNADGPGR